MAVKSETVSEAHPLPPNAISVASSWQLYRAKTGKDKCHTYPLRLDESSAHCADTSSTCKPWHRTRSSSSPPECSPPDPRRNIPDTRKQPGCPTRKTPSRRSQSQRLRSPQPYSTAATFPEASLRFIRATHYEWGELPTTKKWALQKQYEKNLQSG